MKQVIYLMLAIITLNACQTSEKIVQPTPCVDGNGTLYNTVKIGNQLWMKENLRATKYNDGTPIHYEPNFISWSNITFDAMYAWIYNDSSNYAVPYGAIYSGNVVVPELNGNKNICPGGWHVPTKDDIDELIIYLGGQYDAGGKMKEAGTLHWNSPNMGATNSSGFNAVPNYIGSIDKLGDVALYLSSTKDGEVYEIIPGIPETKIYIIQLTNNNPTCYLGKVSSTVYSGIRCISDVKVDE